MSIIKHENGYILPTVGTFVHVLMDKYYCMGQVIDLWGYSIIIEGESTAGPFKTTCVNINHVHSWRAMTYEEYCEKKLGNKLKRHREVKP
jgi:hypothetical protein